MADRQIVIIGLGDVATTHLEVLEELPGGSVIAGVDPGRPAVDSFRGRKLPVFSDIESVPLRFAPDLVVIATPTPLHMQSCKDAAVRWPTADILVEKPAADNLDDARRLLSADGPTPNLDVAYDLAYAPEVEWGVEAAAQLGTPLSATAWFSDPYENDPYAVARFGSSWLDSGINALSVLSRFAEPVSRVSLRSVGPADWSTFEAQVTCRAGGAEFRCLVVTSWHVTAAAKNTRIRFSSGAELFLDHTAVAGHVVEQGAVSALFGTDGTTPRRESHYQGLYRSWLADVGPVPRSAVSREDSRRLHEILLSD